MITIVILTALAAAALFAIGTIFPLPSKRAGELFCRISGRHDYQPADVQVTWVERAPGTNKPWSTISRWQRTVLCTRCSHAPMAHEVFELAIMRSREVDLPETKWPNIRRIASHDRRRPRVHGLKAADRRALGAAAE